MAKNKYPILLALLFLLNSCSKVQETDFTILREIYRQEIENSSRIYAEHKGKEIECLHDFGKPLLMSINNTHHKYVCMMCKDDVSEPEEHEEKYAIPCITEASLADGTEYNAWISVCECGITYRAIIQQVNRNDQTENHQ